MMGKIFSVCTEMVPFAIAYILSGWKGQFTINCNKIMQEIAVQSLFHSSDSVKMTEIAVSSELNYVVFTMLDSSLGMN